MKRSKIKYKQIDKIGELLKGGGKFVFKDGNLIMVKQNEDKI